MITPVGGHLDPNGKPLLGRVVVKRDPHATRVGGVHLPATAVGRGRSSGRRLNTFGTVLSVHRDCTLVEPGDRVCFWEMAGTDLEHDGETITVMPLEELLATVED